MELGSTILLASSFEDTPLGGYLKPWDSSPFLNKLVYLNFCGVVLVCYGITCEASSNIRYLGWKEARFLKPKDFVPTKRKHEGQAGILNSSSDSI